MGEGLFPKSVHFFRFSKKGRSGLPLPPPSCAPAQMQSPGNITIVRKLTKIQESRRKKSVGVLFLILDTKTPYDG